MEQFAIGGAMPVNATGLASIDRNHPLPDPYDTLELIQAFVAILLAEQAGSLTDRQADLLRTIRIRVAEALAPRELGATGLVVAS